MIILFCNKVVRRMPSLPRNFSFGSSSVGDCQYIGAYFDSLTNSILSTSHSMCSAETQPRVQSPTYPMKNDGVEVMKTKNNDREGPVPKQNNTQTTLTTLAPTPKRPPLPTTRSTLQERKKPGLSLTIPQSPDDVQEMPPTCPVSLQRHVELKKKLSSSHFLFRPVSEDDQSNASAVNKKSSSVNRAHF